MLNYNQTNVFATDTVCKYSTTDSMVVVLFMYLCIDHLANII